MVHEVYKLSFPNGKSYIGKTRCGVGLRIRQHYNHKTNQLIHRAFRKYKFACVEILATCSSDEAAAHWEKYYVGKLKTLNPGGYNLNSGGTSNCVVTAECKNRISSTMKQRAKNPDRRSKLITSLGLARSKIITAVKHLESGLVFESQRSAARYFGIHPNYLNRLLKGAYNNCSKGTFVYA